MSTRQLDGASEIRHRLIPSPPCSQEPAAAEGLLADSDVRGVEIEFSGSPPCICRSRVAASSRRPSRVNARLRSRDQIPGMAAASVKNASSRMAVAGAPHSLHRRRPRPGSARSHRHARRVARLHHLPRLAEMLLLAWLGGREPSSIAELNPYAHGRALRHRPRYVRRAVGRGVEAGPQEYRAGGRPRELANRFDKKATPAVTQ